MLSQLTLAVFGLLLSTASAAYSNVTWVPTTVTLSPTYSVAPETSISTYADETTTFFITSTLYSTYWYTPVVTSSFGGVTTSVADLTTTFSSSGELYTSTITSTITSTVRVADSSDTIVAVAKDGNATLDSGCTPVTVTVTATPAAVSTQYVTVTANSSGQWVNGTTTD